jgi:hypothetical protein
MALKRQGRRTALIIPDAHATPDYSNYRFSWLGKLAHDLDPDYIVCLGDWWDFPSLSRHDPLGSRTMEGVRYTRDVEAGNEAARRFFKGYRRNRARKIFTLGNHDVRPEIAVDADPKWAGKVSMLDLDLDWWDEVIPYRDIYQFEGIAVSHHMSAGVSGRPIGGEHMAHTLIRRKHMSCIVGHSHVFQHYVHTRVDGQKLFALVAGCISHPSYGRDHNPRSNWCRDTSEMWSRGVTLLRDLDGKGYYGSLEFITLDKIRRSYALR